MPKFNLDGMPLNNFLRVSNNHYLKIFSRYPKGKYYIFMNHKINFRHFLIIVTQFTVYSTQFENAKTLNTLKIPNR